MVPPALSRPRTPTLGTWCSSPSASGDSEYFNVTNTDNNLEAVITPEEGLNYEVPKDTDRNNIYVFTLTVTDSFGKTDTAAVSVTVVNVVETLTANTGASTVEVEENSPLKTDIGERIEPTDPGDSTYQTYKLNDATDSDGHSAYFRIHRDDGQIYVNKEFDYEATPTLCAANVCSVTVTITGLKTDDDGNSVVVGTATTGTIAITITDVNEAPSYTGTETRYVAENAWKLEGQEYKRDTKTGKPVTLGSTLRSMSRWTIALCHESQHRHGPIQDYGHRRRWCRPSRRRLTRISSHYHRRKGRTADVTDRVLYTLSGPDAMYFGIYRATGQIITSGNAGL